MKAAEQYAAAEEALARADRWDGYNSAFTPEECQVRRANELAEAQVHATLAVAASQMRSLPATQDTTN